MRMFKPVIVVILAFLGFSLMFHASVQAAVISTDRPVATASMALTTVEGEYAGIESVNLFVAESYRSKVPTSIQIVVDGEVRELPISAIAQDECGSVIIQAIGGHPDHVEFVTLKDNTTQFCIERGNNVDDWTAEVELIGFAGTPIGSMTMTGSPQPVFSTAVEQL